MKICKINKRPQGRSRRERYARKADGSLARGALIALTVLMLGSFPCMGQQTLELSPDPLDIVLSGSILKSVDVILRNPAGVTNCTVTFGSSNTGVFTAPGATPLIGLPGLTVRTNTVVITGVAQGTAQLQVSSPAWAADTATVNVYTSEGISLPASVSMTEGDNAEVTIERNGPALSNITVTISRPVGANEISVQGLGGVPAVSDTVDIPVGFSSVTFLILATSPTDGNNIEVTASAAGYGTATTLVSVAAAPPPPEYTDSDSDGIADWWENLYFTNLVTVGLQSQVTNASVFVKGYTDHDNDGLNDFYEYLADTDPAFSSSLDLTGDPDTDGLHNSTEQNVGTHPNYADTDDDGNSDRTEGLAGTSPVDSLASFNWRAISISDVSGQAKFQDQTNGSLYEFCVTLWVYPTATGGGVIFRKENGNEDVNFEIGLNSAGAPYLLYDVDASETQVALTNSYSLPIGAWSHIAAYRNDDNGEIGVISWVETAGVYARWEATKSGLLPPAVGEGTSIIGGGDRAMIGQVDEIRVWDRVLSLEEMGYYFNRAIGRREIEIGFVDELVGYYRFDDGGTSVEDFVHPMTASTNAWQSFFTGRSYSGQLAGGIAFTSGGPNLLGSAFGENALLLTVDDAEYVGSLPYVVAGDAITMRIRRRPGTNSVSGVTNSLAVNMTVSKPDKLSVPAQVVIPAGSGSTTFEAVGLAPGSNNLFVGASAISYTPTNIAIAVLMPTVEIVTAPGMPPLSSSNPDLVLVPDEEIVLSLVRDENYAGGAITFALVPGSDTATYNFETFGVAPETVSMEAGENTTSFTMQGVEAGTNLLYVNLSNVPVASAMIAVRSGILLSGPAQIVIGNKGSISLTAQIAEESLGETGVVVNLSVSDENALMLSTESVTILPGQQTVTFDISGTLVRDSITIDAVASGSSIQPGSWTIDVVPPNLSFLENPYYVEYNNTKKFTLRRPTDESYGSLNVELASIASITNQGVLATNVFTVPGALTFSPGETEASGTINAKSGLNGTNAVLAVYVEGQQDPVTNVLVYLVPKTLRLVRIRWYDNDDDGEYSEEDQVELIFNNTMNVGTMALGNLTIVKFQDSIVYTPYTTYYGVTPSEVPDRVWGFGAIGPTVVNDSTWQYADSHFIITLGQRPGVKKFDLLGIGPTNNVTDITGQPDQTLTPLRLPLYAVSEDNDDDGLPDEWEDDNGLDPDDPDGINGAYGDPDLDGLMNMYEYYASRDYDPEFGSALNPKAYDSDGDGFADYDSRNEPGMSSGVRTWGELYDDGDGIPDAWEVLYDGIDPTTGQRGLDPAYYDAHRDPDKDGWSDYAEYMGKRVDTNGNLVTSTDPLNLNSYPQPLIHVHARYYGKYGNSLDTIIDTNVLVRLNFYKESTMDGFPIGTLNISNVFVETRILNTGHVVEGTNYVFGYLDINNDSVFDPETEPAGITEVSPVSVGWGAINNVEIGLTDKQPGYRRFTWPEDPDASGYIIKVAHSSFQMNRFIKAPRNYFHDGDYLQAGTFGLGGSTDPYVFLIYKRQELAPGLEQEMYHGYTYMIISNASLSTPDVSSIHDVTYSYAFNEISWRMAEAATFYTMQIDNDNTFSTPLLSVTKRAPYRDEQGLYRTSLPFFAGDNYEALSKWQNGRYWLRVRCSTPGGSSSWSPPAAFLLNLAAPEAGGGSMIAGDIYYFGKVYKGYGANNTNLVIIVQAFASEGFSGHPDAQVQVTYNCNTNDPSPDKGDYNLMGLHHEKMYVRAFIDVNGNRTLDKFEPLGFAKDMVTETDYVAREIDLSGIGNIAEKGVRVVIRDRDTDDDQLPDGFEWMIFGNLNYGAFDDPDNDGANNITEYEDTPYDSDPSIPDTDGDGLTDGYELTHGLLTHRVDTDGDGLSDGFEVDIGTDPLDPLGDADGDGVLDVDEVTLGTDPLGRDAKISGSVWYDGVKVKGAVRVAVFADAALKTTPLSYSDLSGPGAYTVGRLFDGTYYVAAVMATSPGFDLDATKSDNPWGMYASRVSPLGVVVISSTETVRNINFELADGNASYPNPFATVKYVKKQPSGLGCYDAVGLYGQPAGSWYLIRDPAEGVITKTFGYAGTVPITGDFDGDGIVDYGCYDAAGSYGQKPGSWYLMRSSAGFTTKTFGYAGTVPITGDFDGDGKDDYGCYDAVGRYGQPAGSWYLTRSSAGFTTKTFGYAGTVPITGDFDGDGKDDYGCYDAVGRYGQPAGSWYLMMSSAGFTTKTFGYAGTVPMAGDFDGDGKDDYGCYDAVGLYGQPAGSWYIMCSYNGFIRKTFGYAGTVPVTGDFDDDGVADYGCYDDIGRFGQPAGSWFLMQSTAGFATIRFGYAGTEPFGL